MPSWGIGPPEPRVRPRWPPEARGTAPRSSGGGPPPEDRGCGDNGGCWLCGGVGYPVFLLAPPRRRRSRPGTVPCRYSFSRPSAPGLPMSVRRPRALCQLLEAQRRGGSREATARMERAVRARLFFFSGNTVYFSVQTVGCAPAPLATDRRNSTDVTNSCGKPHAPGDAQAPTDDTHESQDKAVDSGGEPRAPRGRSDWTRLVASGSQHKNNTKFVRFLPMLAIKRVRL